MSGNPRTISGRESGMSGNPRTISGRESGMSDNPRTISGRESEMSVNIGRSVSALSNDAVARVVASCFKSPTGGGGTYADVIGNNDPGKIEELSDGTPEPSDDVPWKKTSPEVVIRFSKPNDNEDNLSSFGNFFKADEKTPMKINGKSQAFFPLSNPKWLETPIKCTKQEIEKYFVPHSNTEKFGHQYFPGTGCSEFLNSKLQAQKI